MEQPIRQSSMEITRLHEQAVELAVAGKWHEAARINHELLALSPSEVEARNRLGKAYTELGRYDEAMEAYRAALTHDPNNRIAQRNLQTLERARSGDASAKRVSLSAHRHRAAGTARGTAVVTRLARPAPQQTLGGVTEGEALQLRPSPAGIKVLREDGTYLGVLEPRLSRRVDRLMNGGNRYEATANGWSEGGFGVHIVETHRSPEQAHVTPFPPQFSLRSGWTGDLDRYDLPEDERESGTRPEFGLSSDEEIEAEDPSLHSMLSGRTMDQVQADGFSSEG